MSYYSLVIPLVAQLLNNYGMSVCMSQRKGTLCFKRFRDFLVLPTSTFFSFLKDSLLFFFHLIFHQCLAIYGLNWPCSIFFLPALYCVGSCCFSDLFVISSFTDSYNQFQDNHYIYMILSKVMSICPSESRYLTRLYVLLCTVLVLSYIEG